MRMRGALAIIALMTGPVLAQEASEAGRDMTLAIEAVPEVEVRVPSDRTEFSLPLPAAPEGPAVAVAPPRLASDEAGARAPAPAPAAAGLGVPLPEAAPDQPALALGADPFPKLEVLPLPGDAQREIANLPARPATQPLPAPQRPQVAVVPPAERTAPPAPAPQEPGAPARDWRQRLEAAVAEVAPYAPLPPATLQQIRRFYEQRAFEPVFADAAGVSPRGRKVLSTLDRAGDNGLDPRRFRKLADLSRATDADVRDVAIAAAAVVYARDARGARLNPQSVSRLITVKLAIPGGEEVLEGLAAAPDAGAALDGWNPQHDGFRRLKDQLAALRGGEDQTASTQARLTFGQTLWVGMSDARVPLLRAALGLPANGSLEFDRDTSDAVKRLQRERGLRVTGRLDRQTVAALGGVEETGQPSAATSDIIANMERWRWLPADLGDSHVMVNVPSYRLEMKRDGVTAFETRVVVGKPQSPTPIFSHKMEFLVVNPSWNVPPSIATKEYLPLLKANPYALQARGLQIVSRGKVIDPGTVDWSTMGRSVAIRQPPGERNALGNIKFMFPNEHAVYLHDTPSRSLFGAERRAFSHGCVRVQNPFGLASAVMGWSEGRLRSMVGGGERRVDLPSDVDVHLAYFTLEARADGRLVRHEDIYGHHRRTKALLGL